MNQEKAISLRIVANPRIMAGKPVIRGTRIPIDAIIKRFAEGMNIENVIADSPKITKEDIYAALEYSARLVKGEKITQIALK